MPFCLRVYPVENYARNDTSALPVFTAAVERLGLAPPTGSAGMRSVTQERRTSALPRGSALRSGATPKGQNPPVPEGHGWDEFEWFNHPSLISRKLASSASPGSATLSLHISQSIFHGESGQQHFVGLCPTPRACWSSSLLGIRVTSNGCVPRARSSRSAVSRRRGIRSKRGALLYGHDQKGQLCANLNAGTQAQVSISRGGDRFSTSGEPGRTRVCGPDHRERHSPTHRSVQPIGQVGRLLRAAAHHVR